MEISIETPQQLKLEIPFNLAIPLLIIFRKVIKTLYYNDTCIFMFIAAQFMMAKSWKQPMWPSANEWIKKCSIYTQWIATVP